MEPRKLVARLTFASVLLLVAACASPAPRAQVPQPASDGAAPSAAPKSLVMAFPAEPPTLGPFTVVGAFYQLSIYEMVHDFLLVYNDQGQPVPRLAPERPSLENGTWKVFPDGSMETTWRLRSGARWHDGVEFTAQDIVFGWKVANDRQVPWITRAVAEIVDDMRVLDSHTLVMHWKSTFALADRPQETSLDPLPAHLLEPLWMTDPQAFVNSPHWTREFIGLGPFRLAAWDGGSHLELRAVEDHYLGRPRISTVVVRFVTDQNTLVANLLSGTVDVNVTPTNLSFEHWKVLQEQWTDGTLGFDRSGSFQFVGPNLRVPPFGDVRVRRAMTHAIDRTAVVDAQSIPRELIADTFLVPGSEKAQRLKPYVQVYDFDPARAQSLLEEAGWRRGADGLTRNAAGQAFEFDFRSTGPPPSALLVIADLWKAVGLQPNIAIPPPALSADAAYQADVKGVDASGYSIGFGSWRGRVHSAAIPTPATRYGGLNRTYYDNPEVDALIDRFSATLNEADRERTEGEIIALVTRDVVFYPLYVRAQASSVRKGITGIKPVVDSPGLRQPQTTWNIVEWDRS